MKTVFLVCALLMSLIGKLLRFIIPLIRGVLDTSLCDKFSDLRQVGRFHWVLRFPPPIKLSHEIAE
jgi:hypothetical protein